MRSRSLPLGAVEVIGPIFLALAVGIGLYFALVPGIGQANTADPQLVRIYTSVPMNKFASMVHGVEMAISEVNARSGPFRLELVPLNGASSIDGKWDPDVELANARRALEDPNALVYIGTYNSGAAKVSIPVLNRVHMAMISPGNTYPGLTKPGTGSAGEPWLYSPLVQRNYFRVVPADDLQGSAAAAYARQIGIKSVYVLDDTELYGHGIAAIFAQSAKDFGIQLLGGPKGIDVHAPSYSDLAQKIVAAKPGLVYFGGISDNHPGLLLRDLRASGYGGAFMGADGIVDSTFLNQSGGQSQQGNSGAGDIYAT
ncbi:MAG: branched-chain amino acid ABC transporter substrate-binding protein, partial [Chloroflexota bacterium]|nr:branched-chain amino acid ABC transporter substrate-binding protein [Chloroflexota bacterium]